MEVQKIQYLRNNGRNKGQKRGVLFCCVDDSDDNKVIVGFSLCNKSDKFDYIRSLKYPGFGVLIAKERAERWSNHKDYFIQKSWTQEQLNIEEKLFFLKNPNPKTIVEIPPSIFKQLTSFIERCRKYYKDKEFPVWVNKFIEECPYEDIIQSEYYDNPVFVLLNSDDL